MRQRGAKTSVLAVGSMLVALAHGACRPREVPRETPREAQRWDAATPLVADADVPARDAVTVVVAPSDTGAILPESCSGLCERQAQCNDGNADGCAARCTSGQTRARPVGMDAARWICANAPCALLSSCSSAPAIDEAASRWATDFPLLPGASLRLAPGWTSMGEAVLHYASPPESVLRWLRAAAHTEGWIEVASGDGGSPALIADRGAILFTRDGRSVNVEHWRADGTLLRAFDHPPLPVVRRISLGVFSGESEFDAVVARRRFAGSSSWRRCDPPRSEQGESDGRGVIRFTIDASGRVTSATAVEGSTRETLGVARCLANAARSVRFTPPTGGRIAIEVSFDLLGSAP